MNTNDFYDQIKDLLEENYPNSAKMELLELSDNLIDFNLYLQDPYMKEVSYMRNIECEPNIDSLLEALKEADDMEPNELAIEIIRNPEYNGWVTETYERAYDLSGVLSNIRDDIENRRDEIEQELGVNKN
jgi:hypothetical protein